MIPSFVKNWMQQRQQRALIAAHNSGYDYAAGALLRNELTPAELAVQYITADTWSEGGTSRAFDRGMREAVDKLVSLGVVYDNR